MVPIRELPNQKLQLLRLGWVILILINQQAQLRTRNTNPRTPAPKHTANSKEGASNQSPNDKADTRAIFPNLLTHKQNGKLGTAVLANRSIVLSSLLGKSTKTRTERSTKDDKSIRDISRSTTQLHKLADEAINAIYEFTSNLGKMAKRSSRSPRATQILKNLDITISTFVPVKPTAEYAISSYANGHK